MSLLPGQAEGRAMGEGGHCQKHVELFPAELKGRTFTKPGECAAAVGELRGGGFCSCRCKFLRGKQWTFVNICFGGEMCSE